jgi:hypothetical protein
MQHMPFPPGATHTFSYPLPAQLAVSVTNTSDTEGDITIEPSFKPIIEGRRIPAHHTVVVVISIHPPTMLRNSGQVELFLSWGLSASNA